MRTPSNGDVVGGAEAAQHVRLAVRDLWHTVGMEPTVDTHILLRRLS